MDPAQVFRQGLGNVASRPYQPVHHPFQPNFAHRPLTSHDELSEEHAEGNSGRIAHTLTACCRCRQRKTRCDPTLPKCVPCERSGSTCEYLDTAKGRKISRYYVIKLQEKVKALEAELGQYLDDEGDYPHTSEEIMRPGGLVRLGGGDETPRYLGPSSGIAMTRLLMEEAKRFSETNRISDLIPELRAHRQARMQSIQMTGPAAQHKKSYPMLSEHPAEALPTRSVADKLVEIFMQKSQVLWPTLHEKQFQKDLNDVYNGDTDTFKLFIVRMVFAISMQKLDAQYAGLADSYYLAAMRDAEEVIRAKDLKTLQCLILVAQYSLVTPTRSPIYYVIGLATKICQQEGLVKEESIATGYDLDPLTIDMRRRLVWIVATMEFGLAHSLGRPNGFASKDEVLDVEFFSTVDDEYITENGIGPGPVSSRKLAAIHLCRMRILQAEIRRTLYETKRAEPKNDMSPWYQQMEKRLNEWFDASPEDPPWCKPWFSGRCHQMRVMMYRPSPQISRPSPRAAIICYESSEYIINLAQKQMENNAVDITWVFLLTATMSLNTLLWSTSYSEVRQSHPREEVEDLVNKSLEILDRCAERWPGTDSSSHLYAIFAKACLQSYDGKGANTNGTSLLTTPPPPTSDSNFSPDASYQNQQQQTTPFANAPRFGYVFGSPPESMNSYALDPNFPPPHPTFRSNSIFENPATTDTHGRRFSYFPPDFTQLDEITAPEESSPPTATPDTRVSSPPDNMSSNQLPTPPESLANMSAAPSTTLSPPLVPIAQSHIPQQVAMSTVSPPRMNPAQPQNAQRFPLTYGMPPASQPHHPPPPARSAPQQQPLPQPPPSGGEWFTPPAPFISPYNLGAFGSNFYSDPLAGPGGFNELSSVGMGFQGLGGTPVVPGPLDSHMLRQGSLTQTQQMELMNVLETEGISDMDAFLNSTGVPNSRWGY